MSTVSVLLIALAGFFIGGAWAFREQPRSAPFIVLILLVAASLTAAVLWWTPA